MATCYKCRAKDKATAIPMDQVQDSRHGIFRAARNGAVALGLIVGLFSVPALSQGPSLAMLDRIEPGRWELVSRDGSRTRERICLRDARRLLQLQHPGATCERLVVDDTAGEVTVHYTCKGQGFGRTTIRRESSRLIQIDSRGIADGLPFEVSAEGRYIGPCRN